MVYERTFDVKRREPKVCRVVRGLRWPPTARESELGTWKRFVISMRLTVVVPAYNAAATLRETLASVFDQTRKPDEVVVVDDGSVDDTAAIAARCGATVVTQANAGVSAARNAGVRAASGELIALLDADDLWHPEKLARQLAFGEERPELGLTFTDFDEADGAGVRSQMPSIVSRANYREIVKTSLGDDRFLCERDSLCRAFPKWSFIQPSTVIVKRALYLEVGGFDTELSMAEDYDFFLRLFPLADVGVIERRLATYRRYAGQASSNASSLLRSELGLAVAAAAGKKPYHPVTNAYFAGDLLQIRKRIARSLFRGAHYGDAATVWRSVVRAKPTLGSTLNYVVSLFGTLPIGPTTIGASRACVRMVKRRKASPPLEA